MIDYGAQVLAAEFINDQRIVNICPLLKHQHRSGVNWQHFKVHVFVIEHNVNKYVSIYTAHIHTYVLHRKPILSIELYFV